MIKFAIALCILLVALGCSAMAHSYGAEDSSVQEKIKSAYDFFEFKIQEQKAVFFDAWSSVEKRVQDFQQNVKSTINQKTDEWKTKIEELRNKNANLEVCISSEVEFEAIAEAVACNVITCIDATVTQYSSKYKVLIALLFALEDEWAATKNTSRKCPGSLWNRIFGCPDHMGPTISRLTQKLAVLVKDATVVLFSFTKLQSELTRCRTTAGVSSLERELAAAYSRIQICITYLQSTTAAVDTTAPYSETTTAAADTTITW